MSDYTDNPAGRLLALVERVRPQNDNTGGADVWPAVLDVRPGDRALLFTRLSTVAALPQMLRESLESITDLDQTVFFEKFPNIDEAFNRLAFLNEPIAQFKRPLNDSVVMWLKFCSSELHHRCPEPTATADEVEAWISELTAVLAEVNDSDDIGEAMRSFLAAHIRELLDALRWVEVGGFAPVRHAVERTIGDWNIEKDLQREKEHPTFQRVLVLVGKIIVCLSTAWTSYGELQAAFPDLPALPAAPAVVEHVTVHEVPGAITTIAGGSVTVEQPPPAVTPSD